MIKASDSSRDSSRSGRSFTAGSSDDREDLSSATAPLPPGTFTTSAHSDEWKIANALSAGPASITERATVIDRDGRVLRRGTNGWTCMSDVPGRPQHNPCCMDETMMKWIDATKAGKKPDIDRVGLSYMLMGEARQGQGATPAKDPSEVKEWFYIGPHVMIVLPDSAKDALRGINQDLSNNQPYTTLLNSAAAAQNVCFWHKADMPVAFSDVCFWGQSGHSGPRIRSSYAGSLQPWEQGRWPTE